MLPPLQGVRISLIPWAWIETFRAPSHWSGAHEVPLPFDGLAPARPSFLQEHPREVVQLHAHIHRAPSSSMGIVHVYYLQRAGERCVPHDHTLRGIRARPLACMVTRSILIMPRVTISM